MRRVIWHLGETLVVTAMLTGLLLCMRYGSAIYDRMIGRPPAGERLIIAVASGDDDAIDEALAAGAPVDGRDARGTTALMMAAATGSTARIERLLRLGADVNAADVGGMTPVMYAAREGHLDATRALVRNGADLSRRTVDGATAADVARNAGVDAPEDLAALTGVTPRRGRA